MTSRKLNEFIKRYERIARPETVRQRIIHLNDYIRVVGGMNITYDNITKWLDDMHNRGLSAGTIRQYYSALRTYNRIMHLRRDDLLDECAMLLPVYYRDEKHILTVEDVKSIIEHTVDYRDEVIFTLMYVHARRIGEVVALNQQDYDKRKGVITYRIEKKKRFYPIRLMCEPYVKKLLNDYIKRLPDDLRKPEKPLFYGRSGRVNPNSVRYAYKKSCERAGLPIGHPHDLRHARATHLIQIYKVSPKTVQYLLAHSSITTTMDVYAHVMDGWQNEIPNVFGGDEYDENEES